jgi:hypothetical protein
MVSCPRCKHSNFDGFAACSRCGTPLGAAAPGAPAQPFGAPGGPVGLGGGSAGGGLDEYQRLMADRAAAQKRNRMIMAVAVVVVVGGGGFWMLKEKKKKAAAQVVLDAGGRFVEKDKDEMGAFWNCVMSSEVDIGAFQNADQVQQRIESAYFTQQKTFSEHLTTECVPKIEHARSAMSSLSSDAPPEIKEALDKYVATLPKLQSGIESYAEKIKGRSGVKDVDKTIQEVAAAYSADPTPESVAFDKFLTCAIPDLDKKKDMHEVLEYLFKTCKADAVKFMARLHDQCAPLVMTIDKDAKIKPSKAFKAHVKKFVEDEGHQADALADCAKWSRKGKKAVDLEEFLTAFGDYYEGRSGVPDAARESAARITGQALEAPKKKAPGAEAPAAP